MLGFDFIYVTVNLILLFVFAICGRKISKRPKHYWKYAFICIFFFTLVEGLRLNRGVDYIHYLDVYKYDTESSQLLFTAFNRLLKLMGVGPYGAFSFYSFGFITGAMFFLKYFARYAKYAFPLFIVACISFSEGFIRQAFAFTAIFLFFYFLLKQKATVHLKNKQSSLLNKIRIRKNILQFCLLELCLMIAAYSVHTVSAITIFVFVAVYFLADKPIHYYYSIPIYLFASYVFIHLFDWDYLDPILSVLGSANDKFAAYTENSDVWFSSDAMNEIYNRNTYVKIVQTISECSLFYLCFEVLKNCPNRGYVALYNFYFAGSVLMQSFYSVELIRRVGHSIFLFWFIPLSIVLIMSRKIKKKSILFQFCMFAQLFWIYDYLRFLFVPHSAALFLWNL